ARAARGRDWGRTSLQVLAVAAFGFAAVAGAAWLGRREIARDALVGWLDQRGIEAEVGIERLDLDGFTGTVRAGSAGDPDFMAQRVEVDMTVAMPWDKGGFGVKPRRVRLVKPVVKAELKDGELKFGSLDPLVKEFLAKPPKPEEHGPLVLVEDGQLRLTTPYGRLRARGDATIDDGQLLRLDARLPAARLAGKGLAGDLQGAELHATKTGDRLHVRADAAVGEWVSDALDLEDARVEFEGDFPYPDLKKRRGDGTVRMNLAVKADSAGAGDTQTTGDELNLRFDGRVTGWLENFRLIGQAAAAGRVESYSAGSFDGRGGRFEATARALELTRTKDGLDWRAQGGVTLATAQARRDSTFLEGARLDLTDARFAGRGAKGLEGVFRADLNAKRVADGDLSLGGVTGALRGDLRAGEAFLLTLDGGVSAAHGAWTGLGPAKTDDVAELGALKRALGDFRLSAPGLSIETGSPGTSVALTAPVRLVAASGGQAVLTPRRQPLYAAPAEGEGRGAFDLALSGGALPNADVAVSDYRLRFDDAGLNLYATTSAKAGFDFGPVQGGVLQTAGRLAMAGGALTYTPDGCASLSAARLELGENDMVDAYGGLCPAGGPLLRVAGGMWSLSGRVQQAGVTGPFLEMRYENAAGTIEATGAGEDVRAEIRLDTVGVVDIAPVRRFHPERATGLVTLSDDVWRGRLDVTTPLGVKLGELSLVHDAGAGRGEMLIDVKDLSFTPDGLQPSDVTPLVDPLNKATGSVDFFGAFRWTPQTTSSEGRFTTRGLSFESPAGTVTELEGDIRLTSLTPLTSAPDQRITIRRIDSLVALDDATVDFQLLGDMLQIERGDVAAAGGKVVLESFKVPFDPNAAWEGAVVVEGVRLGDIVERSALAEDVDLEARVSGRLPFVVGPNGLKFIQGELHAIEPGRLSIRREALTGVNAAGGETPGAPPNIAQDFAYQALEHLNFEQLDAQVNSLPGGRLGILFHIKGEHAPPERKEITLSLMDVLKKRFFERELPLPSGTKIDLTLDTSFNFDQLLEDFREFNQAKSGMDGAQTLRSGPVQP
ncbi:YdbH domain-containing protein, partial [Caulobacter sp. 17J65-9]|uniref:intermembrane phospholipid transport protein YdbH family protein n=1 Tax=Caulobacter sp. 17J65-9 TaxID=2709382 RepID=UPI0013C9592A